MKISEVIVAPIMFVLILFGFFTLPNLHTTVQNTTSFWGNYDYSLTQEMLQSVPGGSDFSELEKGDELKRQQIELACKAGLGGANSTVCQEKTDTVDINAVSKLMSQASRTFDTMMKTIGISLSLFDTSGRILGIPKEIVLYLGIIFSITFIISLIMLIFNRSDL